MTLLKEKSYGFLLGRLLIFCHKFIQRYGDDIEMVNEAQELLQRYEGEKRVKCKDESRKLFEVIGYN